jgi:hypothetical protein
MKYEPKISTFTLTLGKRSVEVIVKQTRKNLIELILPKSAEVDADEYITLRLVKWLKNWAFQIEQRSENYEYEIDEAVL